MTFHHYLNVYGPDDLLLYSSEPLPLDRVKLAKVIAQVDPADPEALGSYPLTHEQAQKIAGGLTQAGARLFRAPRTYDR